MKQIRVCIKHFSEMPIHSALINRATSVCNTSLKIFNSTKWFVCRSIFRALVFKIKNKKVNKNEGFKMMRNFIHSRKRSFNPISLIIFSLHSMETNWNRVFFSFITSLICYRSRFKYALLNSFRLFSIQATQ